MRRPGGELYRATGQRRVLALPLDLRGRFGVVAVAGSGVEFAFARRGRFVAFGSLVGACCAASGRGIAQLGMKSVASNSFSRMIALGRRTGGPIGARSGSIGARGAAGSSVGGRLPRFRRRPMKGRRPNPQGMWRGYDPHRPMSVAPPSDSAGTFVHGGVRQSTRGSGPSGRSLCWRPQRSAEEVGGRLGAEVDVETRMRTGILEE